MTESLGPSPISPPPASLPPAPKGRGSTKGWAIAAVVVAAVATLVFPPLLLFTLPVSLLIIRKIRQINRDDPSTTTETIDTDRVARASLSSSPSTESVASLPEETDDEEPSPLESVPDANLPSELEDEEPLPLISSSSIPSSAAKAEPEADPVRTALIERGKLLYRRGQEDAKRDLIKLIRELNELPETDIKGRENKQKLIESLALHTIKSETDPAYLESLGKLFESDEITNYTDLINRIQGTIEHDTFDRDALDSLYLTLENLSPQVPEEASSRIADAFRTKLKDTVENLAKLSNKRILPIEVLTRFKPHYDLLAVKLKLPLSIIETEDKDDEKIAKTLQEEEDNKASEDLARKLYGRP